MKNIVKGTSIILIGLMTFFINSYTFADEPNKSGCGEKQIEVKVLTPIPGVNCPKGSSSNTGEIVCCVDQEFHNVRQIISPIIQYITYFSGIIGIMMVVAYGILYSMSGVIDQGFMNTLKSRFRAGIIGLLLLFFSGLILKFIAPWIYT